MISRIWKILAVIFATVIVCCCSLVSAEKAYADIKPWTQYTNNGSSIEWMIDDNGKLIIRPISGTSGVFKYNTSDTGTSYPPWYSYYSPRYKGDIKSVEVQGVIEFQGSMYSLFSECSNLISVDLSNVDVSNMTSTASMFYGCSNLLSINLSNWDTSSVMRMSNMFNGCSNLASLDVTHFNTSNVTDMSSMFQNCFSLTSLDVSNFDTSKVTDMYYMFNQCSSLTALDVSNLDTSNVTSMNYMFYNCSSLTTLDVSNFDTSKVMYMNNMFSGCSSLTLLDLSNWDTSSIPRTDYMFYGCSNLTSLDIRGLKSSRVTYMFQNCERLQTVNFSNGKLPPDSSQLFQRCSSLTTLIVDNLDTSQVTDMSYMFYGCSSLITLDLSSWDVSSVLGNWRSSSGMGNMFNSCSSLTSLDLSNWDTSNVRSMSRMFYDCPSLMSLDVSHFDTGNVLSMGNMFSGCSSLTSLDVSGWDTKNTYELFGVFANCSSLTSIDVSNFDTSNAQYIEGMFANCSSLTSIDISNFDTSNVYSIGSLFAGCSNLVSVNMSGLDLSRLSNGSTGYTYAGYQDSLFAGCDVLESINFSNGKMLLYADGLFSNLPSLIELNLDNVDTSATISMSNLFSGCSSLEELDLSSFDTTDIYKKQGYYWTGVDEWWEESDGGWVESLDDIPGGWYYIDYREEIRGGDLEGMFDGCTSLSKLTLGDYFFFDNSSSSIPCDPKLPNPPAETTLEHWVLEDDLLGGSAVTSEELYHLDSVAGTWVWQTTSVVYIINFSSGDIGTGSMAQVGAAATEDYQIPASSFFYPHKHVVSWDDGNGHVYDAEGIIPADTYTAGDVVTLTAVWADLNGISQIGTGVYELELQPGMSAIIPDIPAGTPYRVYEQTQDGWVLVEQSGTTGTIRPLETSTAKFKNQYVPDVTSAMLYGMKTLDGQAAEAGDYTFELWQGNTKLQTKHNEEGGGIVFDPITYTDTGVYTYTIKEVKGSDDTIVYDSHEEQVNVLVQEVDGHLTAMVEYDSDGITFKNKHNPGNLKINKVVEGATLANADDEFTFRVTLRNGNGEPVTDGVYINYSE